jgi:hypothetical protein
MSWVIGIAVAKLFKTMRRNAYERMMSGQSAIQGLPLR